MMNYDKKLEQAREKLIEAKSKPDNTAQVFANSDMEALYHKFNEKVQDIIAKILEVSNEQSGKLEKLLKLIYKS